VKLGLRLLLFVVFVLAPLNLARGHGSVLLEDDICLLEIGFLEAHFTIFQPDTRGRQEYCEDVPDVGHSVFVLEYLHDFLREMPVGFKIIRDDTNFGRFANWEDVLSLGDLQPYTVFEQQPFEHSFGVMTVNYEFLDEGSYIGIVTASDPRADKSYHSVFQFQVGSRPYGIMLGILALVICLQVFYWYSNRHKEDVGIEEKG